MAPSQRARRLEWARLIAKVFELDPLRCGGCGGTMLIIAFILDPVVIRKILVPAPRRPTPPPSGHRWPGCV